MQVSINRIAFIVHGVGKDVFEGVVETNVQIIKRICNEIRRCIIYFKLKGFV